MPAMYWITHCQLERVFRLRTQYLIFWILIVPIMARRVTIRTWWGSYVAFILMSEWLGHFNLFNDRARVWRIIYRNWWGWKNLLRLLNNRNHLNGPHISIQVVTIWMIWNTDHLVLQLNKVGKRWGPIILERLLNSHHHWLIISWNWNHLSQNW